jgi:hypothetical protein
MNNRLQQTIAYLRRHGLLIGIVLLGAMLRCYHLNVTTNVDESNIIKRAVLVADGQWHIPWYNWPAQSLIHLDGIVYAILTTVWNIVHQQSLSSSQLYQHHAQLFITAAHGLTVICAIIAIIIVYWIGRMVRSHRAGLIGALLLSINYLHTLHSRYATPDVPLTTLWLAMILIAIRLHHHWQHDTPAQYQQHSRRLHIIAGGVWGFAIATKYTALMMVLPLGLVWSYQWWTAARAVSWHAWPRLMIRHLFDRRLLWLVGSGLIMHTLWNPFAIIDYQQIVRAFQFEAQPNRLGVDWGGQDWTFIRNINYYLRGSYAWNGLVVSLLGWITFLISIRYWKQRAWQPMTIISLSYIGFLCGISLLGLHWSRWSLPLTPLILIAAAVAIDYIGQYLRQLQSVWGYRVCKSLLLAGCILILIPPMTLSVMTGYSAARHTTNDALVEYIKQSLPPHAKIVTDTWPLRHHGQWRIDERGIGVYDKTVANYIANDVDYIVVQPARIAYAQKQPEHYHHIITFFHDLKQHGKKIKVFRSTSHTVLENKREDKFYRWLIKHRLSTLGNVTTGENIELWELKK